jgi:hypothetical protein
MCDLRNVIGVGINAGALLAGAIASVVVAIGLNTNFFTSLGAPAPMALAGGLALGVVASLFTMQLLLAEYYRCANARSDRCRGHLANAIAALSGAMATLVVQAGACFTLAGVAWFPWSIQVAAWTVVFGLIPLIATLTTALAFIGQLESCLREPATGSSWGPVSIESEIRGVVRWRPNSMQATRTTDLVEIDARGTGDTTGLAGSVDGSPVRTGEFMQVSFVIRGLTLGVPAFVSVHGRAGAFEVDGRRTTAIEGAQVAGPRPVTLTGVAPTRSDLVFELYELG